MSVKNTLDGSFQDESGSQPVSINLQYHGLFDGTYPSYYVKIGDMCMLYLPSITTNPTSAIASTIQIIIPSEISPKGSSVIHGFTVNDSDGAEDCMLVLSDNSNTFILGKDFPSGTPGVFNNAGPVSIPIYRFILYHFYDS